MPDENLNEQTNNQPDPPEVDTSHDVDELKSMISALQTQIDTLKDELHKKEPEQQKPADFGAYFAQYMTGKKKQ